jgi:uncharacterized protein YeaO (DUF488 family)
MTQYGINHFSNGRSVTDNTEDGSFDSKTGCIETGGSDVIKIKRAYEQPQSDDGFRILVDRLWPRGKKKEQLALDEWDRELAPSDRLRKYFKHDPARWDIFRKRYRRELESNKATQQKLQQLAGLSHRRSVTLVYGAHDSQHNQAVVLKQMIDEC